MLFCQETDEPEQGVHHINFLSRSIAESRGEQLNLHKNLTLFAGLDVTIGQLKSLFCTCLLQSPHAKRASIFAGAVFLSLSPLANGAQMHN